MHEHHVDQAEAAPEVEARIAGGGGEGSGFIYNNIH
jgi:hypothetical protein